MSCNLNKQISSNTNLNQVELIRDGLIEQQKFIPKSETQVTLDDSTAGSLYVVTVFTVGVGNQTNEESTTVITGK